MLACSELPIGRAGTPPTTIRLNIARDDRPRRDDCPFPDRHPGKIIARLPIQA